MSAETLDSVGVIAARFHVPELHQGHRFLIEEVCKSHNDVLIILGVAQSLPTPENPLSFEMRVGMVRSTYPERQFTIVPSFASPKSYFERSKEIDAIIEREFPGRTAVIYGSRKSIIHKYSGKFPIKEIETIFLGSGTEIRNGSQVINSADFRAGVIHTVVHRPPIGRPAVDVALLRRSCRQVLLVGKESEQGWRFPGVYFAADLDESYEAAAVRVVMKELPSIDCGPLTIRGSKKIHDWRYRGSRDTVISLLFSGDASGSTPRPGAGVNRVQWFDLDNIHKTLIPEHRPLAELIQ